MPLFSKSKSSVTDHHPCYDRKEGEEGFSTISLHHGHKARARASVSHIALTILMDASPKIF